MKSFQNKLMIYMVMVLLVSVAPFAKAQHPAVVDYYKFYADNSDEVHRVQLDGALFKMLMWVASWDQQDEDAQIIKRITNNLNGLYILVVPKHVENSYTFDDVKKHVEKDDFTEMMNVREENALISFYSKGNENKIRDLIIFIDDEDEYSIISMRGVLDMKDLKYIAENRGKLN